MQGAPVAVAAVTVAGIAGDGIASVEVPIAAAFQAGATRSPGHAQAAGGTPTTIRIGRTEIASSMAVAGIGRCAAGVIIPIRAGALIRAGGGPGHACIGRAAPAAGRIGRADFTGSELITGVA